MQSEVSDTGIPFLKELGEELQNEEVFKSWGTSCIPWQ